MKFLLLFLIKCYKKLFAASLAAGCRFQPTCSVYAHTSITDFGVVKGSFLAIRRILRCNPLSEGGLDKPKISRWRYRKFL